MIDSLSCLAHEWIKCFKGIVCHLMFATHLFSHRIEHQFIQRSLSLSIFLSNMLSFRMAENQRH